MATQTPQPNKPKFPHLILGIIFIIAALAAAVAGIYYWQTVRNLPSTAYEPIIHKDPTANWKTYINKQYGFSFKYPQGWSIEETQINLNDSAVLTTLVSPEKAKYLLGPFVPSSYSTNIDVLKNSLTNFGSATVSATTFNGLPALEQKISPGNPYEQKAIFFIHNNLVFYVSLSSDMTYNQILSTFKFVDAATIQNQDNTFINTRYKYSFDYSKDYIVRADDYIEPKISSNVYVCLEKTLNQYNACESRLISVIIVTNNSQSLKDVATTWQESNKNNPGNSEVSDLVSKTFLGLPAYEFTIKTTYHELNDLRLVPNNYTQEFSQLYVKKDGIIYQIIRRLENDQATPIFNSFKFTN